MDSKFNRRSKKFGAIFYNVELPPLLCYENSSVRGKRHYSRVVNIACDLNLVEFVGVWLGAQASSDHKKLNKHRNPFYKAGIKIKRGATFGHLK